MNQSFIEVYDNTLTSEECEKLIELFEVNPTKGYGVSGGFNVNMVVKKDIEIACHFEDESEISFIILNGLNEAIKKYHEKYMNGLESTSKWQIDGEYNFQKYEFEDDGYKVWHCEHGPTEDSSKRILAWMIYLNDAESGTEFMYFPKLEAKQGRCVIWPAGWTHAHKSEDNKGLKYIATGWVSYL